MFLSPACLLQFSSPRFADTVSGNAPSLACTHFDTFQPDSSCCSRGYSSNSWEIPHQPYTNPLDQKSHTPCHVCSSNSPANRSVVYPSAKSRIPSHSTSWVHNNYHISGRTWRTHSVGHCAKERWQCKEQTEVLGNQQVVLFHSHLHTLSPASVLCPFVWVAVVALWKMMWHHSSKTPGSVVCLRSSTLPASSFKWFRALGL